ncbi:MAG: L-histidine N(alpha)-methyltransferase [Anaeromyxobacteraceae bacterium]|nr:L-histidine N(alpha)-methyltransferase [Anaeromyxobacteraceae bacterium]
MTKGLERSAGHASRRASPPPHARLLASALAGLTRRPRSLPSPLFYDARGSRLFQWITNLTEYYPTRVEREILETHGEEIVAPVAGSRCTVVDLGAGDGHKTLLLLRRLVAGGTEVAYAPVDISQAALDLARDRVRCELPGVGVRPVRATYARALRQLATAGAGGPVLVLFLGSSIGNLEHAAALGFLVELRRALHPGDHALVGFDLVKPLPVLQAAYADPQGLTAAFNLNLLVRLNRELGADFDVRAFRHVATWDPDRPAMESWLESTRAQRVRIGGVTLDLLAGERIHTEISCKYTGSQVAALAAGAGFAEVGRFTDRAGWFADALWSAAP